MQIARYFTLCFYTLLFTSSCYNERGIPLGQNNAIWTQSIYLRGYQPTTGEPLNEENIKQFAATLKNNNIKYAYLFAGPYNDDGKLPEYAFSNTAVNSIKRLLQYYPEIIILPWVGGVQNKTVYLNDSVWVKNALYDTKRLVTTLNVPGVHIDLEFILSGDPYLDQTIDKENPGEIESYGNNVNEFHKRLREILPHAFVSSVVTATCEGTKPWKRKTSIDELKVLTMYVDQISFLFYDTSINDQKTFEENCLSLVNDIQLLKSMETSKQVQFLIAIGTFVNRYELHKYRNLQIENIPNSLLTIRNSEFKLSSNNRLVDGIAIYSDWETDQSEWQQIRNYWTRY